MQKVAIIECFDEVNCEIQNVTKEDMAALVHRTSIKDPQAFMLASYKVGTWDGLVPFIQDSIGYSYMIPQMIEILDDLGYSVVVHDFVQTKFRSIRVSDDFLLEETGRRLRDHQVNGINVVLSERKGILEYATSSGKTYVALGISKALDGHLKTVIIVPNNQLLDQTYKDYSLSDLTVTKISSKVPSKDRSKLISQNNHIIITEKLFVALIDEFKAGNFALIKDECFHPDHELLTDDGWKPISEIHVGDYIATYDHVTHDVKTEEVQATIVKKYNGSMVLVDGEHFKACVTPTHSMPVYSAFGNAVYVEAKDISDDFSVPTLTGMSEMSIKNYNVQYNGNVYCVSVPSRNVVTRYDGVISIAGNCQIFGDMLLDALRFEVPSFPIRIGMTGSLPKCKLKSAKIKCVLGGDVLDVVEPDDMKRIGATSTEKIVMYKTVDKQINEIFSEMRNQGMYDWSIEQDYILTNRARVEAIGKFITSLPKTNTLVLCHAQFGVFLGEFLNLPMIIDETKTEDRAAMFDLFNQHSDHLQLASYGCAATGISVDRIHRVVLVDVGKNNTYILQSIGRGLRKSDIQDHVEIIDIYGDLRYGNKHKYERVKIYKEKKFDFVESDDIIEIKE